MILMPPRHGKSQLTSQYFAAWYLGTFPDRRVLLTSYEADFAASWGRKARDILEEYGPKVFGVRLRRDSTAGARWDLAGHEGGMNTAGVAGPVTGKGAHLFIIDDPLKNDKDAASKTVRDGQWEWYRSTAYTRLEPGGAIILIMTRWNEDDLAGRLLKQAKEDPEADQWEVISLPGLAEEDDTLGRQPGEALWPERFGEKELLQIKRTIGTYWWNSLYRQKPSPEEGTLFKRSWFRYFRDEGLYYVLAGPEGEKLVEKSKCWIFQTCDPAATEKESSCYFVLATWAVTPDKDLLLLDVFRERAETTKHKQIMKAQYQRWRPTFQGVEEASYGLNIIQDCKKEGLPIRPLPADTDKVSRARPFAARCEVGTVYFRLGAPWMGEWEDELIAFPKGQYKDQVDVASYAGIEIATGIGTVARAAGAKPAGW
jgi:predicted phage terminase large subunit-like protein